MHIQKMTHKRKYIKGRRSPYLKGEKSKELDKKLIIQLVRDLSKTTSRITLKSLGLNKVPITCPILSKRLGRPCSRKYLYHSACQEFGSWNLALQAAKVEGSRPAYNKFWTPKLIVASIKALQKSGHTMMVRDICRDRTRKTTKVLFETVGKKTTGSALHDAARRNLGSWDKALTKAGIKLSSVKEKPFWTKTKIISAIHALKKNGVPLNCQSLQFDQSRASKKIIENNIGKARSAKSLFGAAYRTFGSWDRALAETGISAKNVRQYDFSWRKNSVARILKILHELEVPINRSSLSRDSSDETKEIIYNYTGQIESGTKIYHLGKRMIGDWDDVLRYSGFKISQIRRSGSPCERSRQRVIDYIRLFNLNDYELNSSSVIKYSHFMKFLIEEHYGPAVSGTSLFKAAHSLFGSWDDALWEAGLDPSVIRKRSRPNTSSALCVPCQAEDVVVEGERKLSRFAGNPSKSPEELMEEGENVSILSKAVNKLSDEERELSDRVFDAILNIHHYQDQNDLIRHIVFRLNGEVSEEQVKRLFSRLVQGS